MAGERKETSGKRMMSVASGVIDAMGTIVALGFAAIWILGFGAGVVLMWVDPQGLQASRPEAMSTKLGMTGAFFAGIWLLWWLGIPPRQVAITPDGLRISTLWWSELVAFADVEDIDQFTWTHPRMVTLRFRRPTIFGRVVRYRPRGSLVFSFVGMGGEDADVVEIRTRSIRARGGPS